MGSSKDFHHVGGVVDLYVVFGFDLFFCVVGVDHGGDVEFVGHDCWVRDCVVGFGHQVVDLGEQHDPCWVGHVVYEDVFLLHLVELF